MTRVSLPEGSDKSALPSFNPSPGQSQVVNQRNLQAGNGSVLTAIHLLRI